MKKLYFLNEEEKQRILKLHKSRQVGKFWLNEQALDNPDETMETGLPRGTWTKEQASMFDLVINNYKKMSAGERDRFINGIKSFCADNVFGSPTMSTTALKANGKAFEILMKRNAYTIAIFSGGRGFANPKELVPYFQELKNIPNFCWSVKNITDLRGEETIIDIADEIFNETDFVANFINPVKALAIATKIATYDTEEGEKIKAKGGVDDAEWEKTQLEFYKTYPCLADVAVASKAKNAIVVQNPSEHEQIIDQSQRKRTNITDKTTFMSDGTYITYTDAKANALSGKFQCSRDGELTLLYPGKVGMGSEGGIYSKWPCLGQSRKDGTPYTEIDSSDNNQAIMADEERKTHPIFSGYPEGDIYFSIDGTFLTENDFNNDLDKSGRFKCKSKGRIFAAPFKGVSTEPIKPNPIVTTTNRGGSKTAGGMGTVSASPSYISEILKCAKIGGSTLDQNALNQLYDYIKNNK